MRAHFSILVAPARRPSLHLLVSSHSLSTLSKKIKPSAAYTANLAGAWKGGAGTAGLFLPKKSDWFKGMCRVCCGAYCPVIKWPRLECIIECSCIARWPISHAGARLLSFQQAVKALGWRGEGAREALSNTFVRCYAAHTAPSLARVYSTSSEPGAVTTVAVSCRSAAPLIRRALPRSKPSDRRTSY